MGSKLRHLPASVVRTREATDADGKLLGIVEGYSAIYDEQYRVGAGITESISQRAFDRSITERGGVIPVFWAHGWKKNNDTPIGHAEVREDATGLHTTAYLYIEDEPRVRSLYNAVVSGAIREWSVGFLPTDAGIVATRTATGVNEDIVDADLIETSLALKGMNPGTFVSNTRDDDLEGDADEDADPDDAAGQAGGETERERTHGEIRELLNRELSAQYASGDGQWLWIRDVSDEWVVWELENGSDTGLYKADYSIDADGAVTFGDVTAVEVHAEYVTVAETRDADLLASLANPAVRSELRSRIAATD